MLIDGCWQFVGGWWLRLRWLLIWTGVAVGLVVGVCGVVGRLVGSWGWAGEFHTSQCSAFQSGVESALGKAGSWSSGSAGTIWHWCSGWGVRSGGQVGCVCVLGHRDSIHSRVAIG